MEQPSTDAAATAAKRIASHLSTGRERPDLSGEFFNSGDPNTTTPYLVTRTREVSLDSLRRSEEATQHAPSAALIVTLTGELDLFSTQGLFYPLLDRVLAEFSNVSATPPVVILAIDLSSLAFIDSAGLKQMIELRRRTANLPGRLAIATGEPESQVDYVWRLGRFDTFFITCRTIEQAITAALAELDKPIE